VVGVLGAKIEIWILIVCVFLIFELSILIFKTLVSLKINSGSSLAIIDGYKRLIVMFLFLS